MAHIPLTCQHPGALRARHRDSRSSHWPTAPRALFVTRMGSRAQQLHSSCRSQLPGDFTDLWPPLWALSSASPPDSVSASCPFPARPETPSEQGLPSASFLSPGGVRQSNHTPPDRTEKEYTYMIMGPQQKHVERSRIPLIK